MEGSVEYPAGDLHPQQDSEQNVKFQTELQLPPTRCTGQFSTAHLGEEQLSYRDGLNLFPSFHSHHALRNSRNLPSHTNTRAAGSHWKATGAFVVADSDLMHASLFKTWCQMIYWSQLKRENECLQVSGV